MDWYPSQVDMQGELIYITQKDTEMNIEINIHRCKCWYAHTHVHKCPDSIALFIEKPWEWHHANNTVILLIDFVYTCAMLRHSAVSDSSVTLWNVAHQAPLSMGFPIFHYVMERVAISSSGGSFRSRDQTCVSYVSCIGRWVLPH